MAGGSAGWLSAAPSLLLPGLGVFRLCCSAPVLPASDFDVPPLSSEIFLTFTVGEEGMAVFVAAVTGSERP